MNRRLSQKIRTPTLTRQNSSQHRPSFGATPTNSGRQIDPRRNIARTTQNEGYNTMTTEVFVSLLIACVQTYFNQHNSEQWNIPRHEQIRMNNIIDSVGSSSWNAWVQVLHDATYDDHHFWIRIQQDLINSQKTSSTGYFTLPQASIHALFKLWRSYDSDSETHFHHSIRGLSALDTLASAAGHPTDSTDADAYPPSSTSYSRLDAAHLSTPAKTASSATSEDSGNGTPHTGYGSQSKPLDRSMNSEVRQPTRLPQRVRGLATPSLSRPSLRPQLRQQQQQQQQQAPTELHESDDSHPATSASVTDNISDHDDANDHSGFPLLNHSLMSLPNPTVASDDPEVDNDHDNTLMQGINASILHSGGDDDDDDLNGLHGLPPQPTPHKPHQHQRKMPLSPAVSAQRDFDHEDAQHQSDQHESSSTTLNTSRVSAFNASIVSTNSLNTSVHRGNLPSQTTHQRMVTVFGYQPSLSKEVITILASNGSIATTQQLGSAGRGQKAVLGRCVIEFKTVQAANSCLAKNGTINLNGHLLGIIPFSPSHLSNDTSNLSRNKGAWKNDQVRMLESIDQQNAQRLHVNVNHSLYVSNLRKPTPSTVWDRICDRLSLPQNARGQNLVLITIFIFSILAVLYSLIR